MAERGFSHPKHVLLQSNYHALTMISHLFDNQIGVMICFAACPSGGGDDLIKAIGNDNELTKTKDT